MNEFDLQLAVDLMAVSEKSYDGNATDLLFDCEMGNARAIVCALSGRDEIAISLRGTIESLDDWLHDFNISPVEMKLFNDAVIEVHSGFLDKMSLVRAQLDDYLRENHPTTRRYYTGHSQGGACAPMYVAVATDPGLCAGIYTYGQPRYCQIDGVDILNALFSNYWRVIDHDDIVPRAPSGGGWEHVGRIAMMSPDGNITFPAVQGWSSINIIEDVNDHHEQLYLQRLQEALAKTNTSR